MDSLWVVSPSQNCSIADFRFAGSCRIARTCGRECRGQLVPGAFQCVSRKEMIDDIAEHFPTGHDFTNLETSWQPLSSISTIPISRWVGHILQSRAMNIATSATSTALVFQNASNIQGIPRTFFFNSRALEILLPDISPPSVCKFMVFSCR